MAKHRGGRGRAKRRRCAFVVMEECGNVPAPCQTSLKGVRAHSAGVGKPARDGAHTGVRGRGCMGLPGDIWKRKGSREKGENPKEKRGLGRPGSSICLCPLTPTIPTNATSSHPTPPTHKVAVRVRVCVFIKHSSSFTTSSSSSPSRLECLCLDWCSLRDEGYSLHRPTTCVAPAWSTGMRLMQDLFTQDANASSAFCRTCRLRSIVLTA